MSNKPEYSPEEILSEHDYSSRHRRGKILFHGGFDGGGGYVPPRSKVRVPAIHEWTERLRADGHPSEVVRLEDVEREFFPNVEQSKLLLRHGALDAMTRILTMIGITEGFGNDGIKVFPQLELQDYFRESIQSTALQHLHRGLFEAHGYDEAGRGNEKGHDAMWYEIRDAALRSPKVTQDMFENLPIAPPPGYTGPAKPAAEAIQVSDITNQIYPGKLDFMFEVLLTAMMQVLVIELMAYSTFRWAQTVLADPACSAEPQWVPRMVDYIQADENIHVSYLQCGLSEARARTIVTTDGGTLAGAEVIDAIARKIVASQMGSRWDRLMGFRMKQIRAELEERADGEELLAKFAAAGPVPEVAQAA